MTPKQTEKLRKKIADIRRVLAAEKRKFGGFFDNRGLRYIPPKYFVKLGDYAGGLTYLRWFQKNFPDDVGYPDFLFECTVILYKAGKLKLAEKKALETYCSNTYLFDKFFERPIIPVEKWEGSGAETAAYTAYFNYSSKQHELSDFSQWLQEFLAGEKFNSFAGKFLDIQKKLKTERDSELRGYLLLHERQMVENF